VSSLPPPGRVPVGFTVREASATDAATVTEVIHRAFAGRPPLDPPSTALSETEEGVRAALTAGSGLLAEVDGEPAGSMIFAEVADEAGTLLSLRRVSVLPQWQGRGVATAMVGVAEDAARRRGLAGVRLIARRELTGTVAFWRRRGYLTTDDGTPDLLMRKLFLPASLPLLVPRAEDMRTLGRVLAGELRAGDLILLVGGLGAGKTTLTQGIGAGLEVTGDVISPTFVIARVHHSPAHRPDLVHADAYRLGGVAELDDLDLDTAMDRSVTVVEWGEGVADVLATERLTVRLDRNSGPLLDAPLPDEPVDPRTVTLHGTGSRWGPDVLERIAHRYCTYVGAGNIGAGNAGAGDIGAGDIGARHVGGGAVDA